MHDKDNLPFEWFNKEYFRNGNHIATNNDFCHWFNKYLKKFTRNKSGVANLCIKRPRPKYITCLGAYCRGERKFRSFYTGERLCPKCTRANIGKIPIRDNVGLFDNVNYSERGL